MIPPTDPRTSATPQGAPYVPPVQTLRRPGATHLPDVHHGAQLSAMVTYPRALQEHLRADRRLNDQARDAAVRFQALAHALKSVTVVEPVDRPAPPATGSVPEASLSDLESAFLRWLADPVDADEIRLDDHDRSHRPMEQIVDALRSSTRPLPGEVAAKLGMPAGTTIGQAASELRLAVDDPAGPRCRSYRAAAYHLSGLDRFALVTAEVEKALR